MFYRSVVCVGIFVPRSWIDLDTSRSNFGIEFGTLLFTPLELCVPQLGIVCSQPRNLECVVGIPFPELGSTLESDLGTALHE